MFQLIHQNNDLCDVSGYPFETLDGALEAASKRIGATAGRAFDLHAAEVWVENGPMFPCYVVVPKAGQVGDPFCREGQMTLVARPYYAAEIASRLTRRHKAHGVGTLFVKTGLPVATHGATPVKVTKMSR